MKRFESLLWWALDSIFNGGEAYRAMKAYEAACQEAR